MTLASLIAFLESFAPPALAESWDNVGLLVGDRRRDIARVMTCLTITDSTAQEALQERADLIVTHHPLPFRPLKRLTADTHEGRLLLDLIGGGVAIYSPHTGFDSARAGINQQLAEGLGLGEVRPLVPAGDGAANAAGVVDTAASDGSGSMAGGGRFGVLGAGRSLGELAAAVKRFLAIERVQVVGAVDEPVVRVAVACGSAGEFLEPALAAGCQALVTGETRFHTCLAAEAAGVGLVLAGHFASERFAVETLAAVLQRQFESLRVWASQCETDPLIWL